MHIKFKTAYTNPNELYTNLHKKSMCISFNGLWKYHSALCVCVCVM